MHHFFNSYLKKSAPLSALILFFAVCFIQPASAQEPFATYPPLPPSSKYITPEGKQRLIDEFTSLWKIKRPDVTAALAAAAAEGDRSENAEYIYRKKQLREIDSLMHALRAVMAESQDAGQVAAATEALAKGTEAFAAERMNHSIQLALAGRSVESL